MKGLLNSLISLSLSASIAMGASPYATTSATQGSSPPTTYAYDSAGNRIYNSQGQAILMGLIGKPERIQQGTQKTFFHYATSGRRYLRKHADQSTTLYVGGLEYRLPPPDEANPPKSIVHVKAYGYSLIAQVDASTSNPQYHFFLQDTLANPLSIVDDSGEVVTRKRFEPWGEMTDASGVAIPPTRENEETRGFTGHETIATGNLIHMNGRVYDPSLSLFLGPDRFLQGNSIASLNRFSYVQNSPVNFTDPTGWKMAFVPLEDASVFRKNSRFVSEKLYNQKINHLNASIANATSNPRLNRIHRGFQRSAKHGFLIDIAKDHATLSSTSSDAVYTIKFGAENELSSIQDAFSREWNSITDRHKIGRISNAPSPDFVDLGEAHANHQGRLRMNTGKTKALREVWNEDGTRSTIYSFGINSKGIPFGIPKVDFVIMQDLRLKLGFRHLHIGQGITWFLAAGEMEIGPNGEVLKVNERSGHIRPNTAQFSQFSTWFEMIGVDTSNTTFQAGNFFDWK